MGLWEHWPYTNFHELNLDWICRFVKKVRDRLDLIDKAVADAQEARDKSEEYSLESEAWAVGTKNGEPVDADAPQHENNSKYWAQQAAGSAEDASGYAGDAQGYANDAKGYAEDAAASAADTTQADAAKAWAQQSEAWAVGTKDGVAVGNDEPQYENNSKYWAEQAAGAASAEVVAAKSMGIGNIARFLVQGCEVRAQRDIYNGNTLTMSLNIPGLVAIRLPYANTGSLNYDYSDGEVGFRRNADYYVVAHSNLLRDTKYRIDFVTDGVVIVEDDTQTGERYDLLLFTVFDLTTGQYASDGTTLDIDFMVCRSQFIDNGEARNLRHIGGDWPQPV